MITLWCVVCCVVVSVFFFEGAKRSAKQDIGTGPDLVKVSND